MAEGKWTPEPWVAQKEAGGIGDWEIRGGDDGRVLIAWVTADVDHPGQAEADVRLIAAAPAMAEAIRAAIEWFAARRGLWDDEGSAKARHDDLAAALALAEGTGGA